jgi:FkbM family methyltransferase
MSSTIESFKKEFAHIMHNSSAESWFRVRLNEHLCWLPRDTVLTMTHCAIRSDQCAADLWVESAHLAWMLSKLRPGGIFLDVGAATGAMTLPVSRQFDGQIEIIAFEPARKARRLLVATVERNRLPGIRVVDAAISSEEGEVLFSEYGFDETGQTPYLPEASAIHSSLIDLSRVRQYKIKTLTLDLLAKDLSSDKRPIVVKVDVEGFESSVLKGARNLVRTARPWFAIDIHRDPFEAGITTEPFVRSFFSEFRYDVKMLAHVALCSPE